MFYSESILARKGALAKVWLAAHWEKKLSKAQFLQTNIQSSVGAIIDVGNAPMALRLSGQLLLGVVRIYSRKARYLLEDCNEALIKIKMAFRPGAVDVAEEHVVANINAVTLADNLNQFDILLPEPTLDLGDLIAADTTTNLVSRAQDITLQEQFRDDTMAGPDDMTTAFGIDLNVDQSALDDGWNLNLMDDLDFVQQDNNRILLVEEESTIEIGRDAAIKPEENSLMDVTLDLEKARNDVNDSLIAPAAEPEFSFEAINNNNTTVSFDQDKSMNNDDQADMNIDDMDQIVYYNDDILGGDYDAFELPQNDKTPTNARAVHDETFVPGVSLSKDDIMFQIETPAPKRKRAQTKRKRKLIIDDEIELSSKTVMAHLKYTSDITEPIKFIASSRTIETLLELEKQDVEELLNDWNRPRIPASAQTLFSFKLKNASAPLHPPASTVYADLIALNENTNSILPEELIEGNVEDEKMEYLDAAPDQDATNMTHLDFGADDGMGFDYGFDGVSEILPAVNLEMEMEKDNNKNQDQYILGTIQEVDERIEQLPLEEEEINLDKHNKTILFDNEEDEESQTNEKGYSKSTVKAIQMIKDSFEDKNEVMFSELTTSGTRSDAVRMFFELLVLKTKNMIDVVQNEAFGDIQVVPTEQLYVN